MPTIMIDGKKHTPSSGTLRKMKKKAKAAKAAEAPKKKKAKAPVPKDKPKKPPIPKDRPKPKTTTADDVANSPNIKKLKGPKKKKQGHGIEMGKYRLK